MAESGPIFAFTDDGLNIFSSLEAAASYMEGIDVADGGWSPIFTVDGRVVHARAEGKAAIPSITETEDLEGLRRHVRDDLVRQNEWLRKDWEARWPKRPGWLDRRCTARLRGRCDLDVLGLPTPKQTQERRLSVSLKAVAQVV